MPLSTARGWERSEALGESFPGRGEGKRRREGGEGEGEREGSGAAGAARSTAGGGGAIPGTAPGELLQPDRPPKCGTEISGWENESPATGIRLIQGWPGFQPLSAPTHQGWRRQDNICAEGDVADMLKAEGGRGSG